MSERTTELGRSRERKIARQTGIELQGSRKWKCKVETWPHTCFAAESMRPFQGARKPGEEVCSLLMATMASL